MAEQEETKSNVFQARDLRISSNGKFAALKVSSKPAEGDEHMDLLVFNIETGKKLFDHHEASITHMEWHPVFNKLLFIGVVSGLNTIDITDEGSKDLIEGVVKHSILFLEFFHFSPKGKSAAYLLRNISIIPESAEMEETTIKQVILDEEKAQVLFCEKADISDSIEGLGRAWNWLDEDQIIYTYQGDIFVKDIVWNSKKKLAAFDEFIMDFVPVNKKVLIVSIDYKHLLDGMGSFNVSLLDLDKNTIEPISIKDDFVPELLPLGSCLVFNRKEEDIYTVVKYDMDTSEETPLTLPEEVCKFPRPLKNNIFYLKETNDKVELCRVNSSGEDNKTLFDVSEFFN